MPISLPPGAVYVDEFITADEEQRLQRNLYSGEWSSDLKRRVQHFGYRYDYRARSILPDSYLGPLPDWLSSIGQRIARAGSFDRVPDQVIANEYEPGQGISAHIDCEPCFGNVIASLSLLSATVMILADTIQSVRTELLLKPRSLLILSDRARHEWTHEIPARKADVVDTIRIARSRRVSLTFRTVIHSS